MLLIDGGEQILTDAGAPVSDLVPDTQGAT
jgi:hypothetical protein